MKTIVTQARLREVFSYDPETGLFVRIISRSNRSKMGVPSGSRTGAGYLSLNIDHKNYLAHRLAWLYVHGEWPKHGLDHINGIRDDNRIANLRDVPQRINAENRRTALTNKSTGLLGAYRATDSSAFTSIIRTAGKQIYLGTFDSAQQAHAAYVAAKRVYHNGCTI